MRFDIPLFLGTGRFATASATTLEAARIEAAGLAAEHPTARRPLIHGVTAEGRSALVTAYWGQFPRWQASLRGRGYRTP